MSKQLITVDSGLHVNTTTMNFKQFRVIRLISVLDQLTRLALFDNEETQQPTTNSYEENSSYYYVMKLTILMTNASDLLL